MHMKTLVTALGAAVAVSAQSNLTSLTSLIANTPSLAQLAAVLEAYPSVAATLATLSNVTVLAPDNAAFNAANLPSNASVADVTALLSYHVIPGIVPSTAFSEIPAFLPTLLNDNAYSLVVGGQVVEAVLDGADATVISGNKAVSTVVTADVRFRGGIVHIIDTVLTIPKPPSTALNAAGLTDLLGAIVLTNLTGPVDATAETTIFAPSNAAFAAIGSAAANLSISALARILEYHVVVGHVAYSVDIMSGAVPSLLGPNVLLEILPGGAVFANGARVINVDILTSTGVVHVIDAVLNPANMSMPLNSTAPVPQFASVSSAALPALLTSGLPVASSTFTALQATTLSVAAGLPLSSSVAPSSVPASSSAVPSSSMA